MKTLIQGLMAVLCAGLLSFCCTPLIRVLAYRLRAVDIPRDNRRMHKVPTPRMGGVAIFIGICLTMLAFCRPSGFITSALFGTLIMVVMGVFDDIFSLNAFLKLGVQIVAALVVALNGVCVKFISIGDKFYSFGSWSIVITVIWIVALTNALNLIDGLDGLACGISVICSISLLFVTLIVGDVQAALITAIIVGACLGFMPYNIHPAKIFMGDSGSQPLGFLLAVLSVQGVFKTSTVLSFLIPLSIFALPLFDTTIAIIRRILHGKSPFSADRGHIHHRLIDLGFGQKKSVRILYSVCGIMGCAAVLLSLEKYVPAIIMLVSGITLFIVSAGVFKRPHFRPLTGLFDQIDAIESGVKTMSEAKAANIIAKKSESSDSDNKA